MTLEIYLAYVLACVLITVVPGPTVTVIVANSLAHGTRAGLLNVAVFDWLRIAGALYLAWLGWKLIRSPDALGQQAGAAVPRGGFFLQGLLVLLANPKALFFFGAFIPQFVNPKGDYVAQIVLLGATAMAAALLTDGAYAILTGRAGTFLSKRRVRLLSRLSGGFLIAGGLWLALTRSR
jgi:threonine/homoserine/homoserine lactone efflux protein